MSKRSGKQRRQPRKNEVERAYDIPVTLYDRLLEFCATRGFDEEVAINQAVRKYLDRAAEEAALANERLFATFGRAIVLRADVYECLMALCAEAGANRDAVVHAAVMRHIAWCRAEVAREEQRDRSPVRHRRVQAPKELPL
jgi:hypothetical protein